MDHAQALKHGGDLIAALAAVSYWFSWLPTTLSMLASFLAICWYIGRFIEAKRQKDD